MYSALEIANYIVSTGKVSNLTHLKLQKLLYYVYGVYWKECQQRLFKDSFHAWELGPVVKSVYKAYRGYSSKQITTPATSTLVNLPDDHKHVIDSVLDVFGSKSAPELVTLTHLTTPWIEAFKDPLNDEMFTESIHKYFDKELI